MKRAETSIFGLRLKEAFNHASNTEIARSLGLSNSAITTYMDGRIPPAETLIEISRLTGCSIHWLLTGEGFKEVGSNDGSKRAQTIVFSNMAGGEAKSTSAALIAAEFAKRGHRTLLIDTWNGSGAFTLFGSLSRKGISNSKKNLVQFVRYIKRAALGGRIFFRTPIEGLDICTTDEDQQFLLLAQDVKIVHPNLSAINKEYAFVILDTVRDPFDSIEFLVTSLITTVYVLIPTSGRPLSLRGVETTLELLRNKQKQLPNINFLGTFLAKFDSKMCKLAVAVDKLNELAPDRLLKTVVHNSRAFLEDGETIQLTQPKSRIVAEYASLAAEVLALLEETTVLDGSA